MCVFGISSPVNAFVMVFLSSGTFRFARRHSGLLCVTFFQGTALTSLPKHHFVSSEECYRVSLKYH